MSPSRNTPQRATEEELRDGERQMRAAQDRLDRQREEDGQLELEDGRVEERPKEAEDPQKALEDVNQGTRDSATGSMMPPRRNSPVDGTSQASRRSPCSKDSSFPANEDSSYGRTKTK